MSAHSERLTFGHGLVGIVPSQVRVAAALAHEPPAVRLTRIETWDWAWGGLLLFSMLLYFRPQDQLGHFGGLHLSDVTAAIGLGAMIFLNLSRGKPVTRMTPELAGIFAFGAVILLTVPTSIWPGGAVRVFTDLYLKVALIFMLMVNAVTSPKRIERICWIIVLAFGLVAARAWFDYARGVNLVEGSRVRGAAGGFFENPNDLALNLAAFLPITFMYVKRPGPAFKRLLSAVICILMLGAIVFTKSRSGMVGTAVMLVVFLIVSRSLTPTTMLAGILSVLLITPMLPQTFWDRMASITNEELDESGSREARRTLLREAWNVFLDRPLTGVGAGQFKNYAGPNQAHKWRVTHNVLLEFAADLGIFGVAVFSFLIVRAFAAAWWTRRALSWMYRRRKRRGTLDEPEDGLEPHERMFLETHASAMLAALAGWFVCAQFASVGLNWTFYYLLGLTVCARDVVKARAKAYAQAKGLSGNGAVAA